jgi:DNA-binding transcriptional MerR regulator
MTIGQVAKRSGLRASAIRYYERVGLLPKPARSGGQRRYDSRILDRLAVLERAKNCGFTLDALMERIRGMRELIERGCQCADFDECGRRILVAQASGLRGKPEACPT